MAMMIMSLMPANVTFRIIIYNIKYYVNGYLDFPYVPY